MSHDVFIKTPDDVLKRVHIFQRFELQYPGFAKITGVRICNETILDRIHERMRDLGYSQKIIDRTFIDNVEISNDGELSCDVISDYQSERGFDVAKAREEGTRLHFVAPVFATFLSWIIQGVRMFSKGHWVKGITRSNVIDRTVEEFLPVAQNKLDSETDEMLSKILSS